MVEVRNGSGKVLKQYVWGLQYVDELCQIGHNDNPADAGENNCDSFYWTLQDANFNVLGLVGDDGNLKERYEYTPYGLRTVYTTAGTSDPMAMCPLLDSGGATTENPMGLCDVGHQGLSWDREFQKYNNRMRIYDPQGRFLQRDPLMYIDGMSMYEYVRSNPIGWFDPWGLETILGIHSNTSHSWITVYDTETKRRICYGVWHHDYVSPEAWKQKIRPYSDVYIGLEDEYAWDHANRFHRITPEQAKELNQFLLEDHKHTLVTNNCASLAEEVDKRFGGDELDADSWFHAETPTELAESIREFEAKDPTGHLVTGETPVTTTEKPCGNSSSGSSGSSSGP